MKSGVDAIGGTQEGCGAGLLTVVKQKLTLIAVGLAAQALSFGAVPSFDGGIVIKNGDPEYAEGGAWEDGKNKGDYYRYGMDHGEARKTTVIGKRKSN